MNKALARTLGIILYKEQASLLLNELMQNAEDHSSSANFMHWDKFIESLKAEYKNKLSEKEKNAIYIGLLTYSGIKMNSYDWCREIARLIRKEAKSKKNEISGFKKQP